MCGIVGKISFNGAVEQLLIERMCSVIEHRGPDSRGVFLEDGVGLGVQRLAIIDLETGDQPMFNEDRSVVVLLNGEIYNYRELRSSLLKSGHSFSSQSDTEVIAHLYEDYGDECVGHLRGMFAFALWDRRRRRLILARDRIGKKPLYYASRHNGFWFASEAKAILQDPEVPRDVDYGAIDVFLQYQCVPQPYCAFAALSKLKPAHLLILEDGRLDVRRYWKLSYEDQILISDEEKSELIRNELLEATRLRLRSDVPVGAFLSGGVDSTAVVAAMAREFSSPIQTFTIGFKSDRFDERDPARQIAEILGAEHHEFVVEPDIVDLLPRLAWHYSEPFADQSAVPSFYLADVTRQAVTVALNGDGGDESFGGYMRYRGNDLAERLRRFPTPVAGILSGILGRIGRGPTQDALRARLLRLLRGLQLDPADRYAMWTACFDERERRMLYTSAFLEQVKEGNVGEGNVGSVIREPFEASDAETLIERLLDVDTQTYLADQLLVKMDIASMAHSLEVRSPLLDHKFMEMAAALPLDAKVSGKTTKRLLKDAVRAWVPGDILDRPKRGFSMPLSEWFRGELRELPREILLSPQARSRDLFSVPALERLITVHQRGTNDNSDKLWALIQLEMWFRTYADVAPTGPVDLELECLTPRG